MRFLDEDLAAGYPKIWFELQAMAWNHPEMRERVATVNAQWRAVLTDAFRAAFDEYGLDRTQVPVSAVVSLVMTFNEGIMLERLSGVSQGHRQLLRVIDSWLQTLEDDEGRRGDEGVRA